MGNNLFAQRGTRYFVFAKANVDCGIYLVDPVCVRPRDEDTGRQVFMLALDLLDQPQELYRRAGSALRKTINQTIFAKLKLDGAVVTADELAEPFDVIVPAGRAYETVTYQRKRPPAVLGGVVFHEGVSANDLTSTDLLTLALLGDTGSNKDLMVGATGFEPVTPRL